MPTMTNATDVFVPVLGADDALSPSVSPPADPLDEKIYGQSVEYGYSSQHYNGHPISSPPATVPSGTSTAAAIAARPKKVAVSPAATAASKSRKAAQPIEVKPEPYDEEYESGNKKGSRVSKKRAEQNRAAQKAFRERKMQYIKNLEEQLEAAMQKTADAERLRKENSEMRAMIQALKTENERLKVEGVDAESSEETLTREATPSTPLNVQRLKIEITDEVLLQSVLDHVDEHGNVAFSWDTEEPADPLLFNPITDEGNFYASDLSDLDFANILQQNATVDGFVSYDASSPALGLDGVSVVPEIGVKRNRDEANFYVPPPLTPSAVENIFRSKNEYFEKDPEQNELCELLSKTSCKEVNPEVCKTSKFFKRATA